MNNISLAVKYRPTTFNDVVGQENVVKILKQQVLTNTIKNCYLFTGSSGCGKAQPLTSKILTKNGYITMGEAKVGDIILDGKGKETKILNTFPQGKRDIYRIYFTDNSFIEVADNHLNSIYRINQDKDNKRENFVLTTLELKKLLEDDCRKNRFSLYVDIPKIDCWDSKDVLIDPYLLGCLIGDGCLSKRGLTFCNKDEDIIKSLNLILERDYNTYLKKKNSNNQDRYSYNIKDINENKYDLYYKNKLFTHLPELIKYLVDEGYPKFDPETILRIADNKAVNIFKKYPELKSSIKVNIKDKNIWNSKNNLRTHLETLKLFNKNSYNKFIPTCYLYADERVRLALLQGLMDTDGTVNVSVSKEGRKGASCEFSTTSKQLADDVAFLARSLGFFVNIREKKNRTYTYKYKNNIEKRPCADYWELRIKTNNDEYLFNLKRKKEKTIIHQHEPRRKIQKIEFDRIDDCKCIYVESPEHTYITDNLTITHNTTLSRILANEVNKGSGGLIEIDAASNSSVDNVRNIIDSANTKSLTGNYKIFLVDECHSLSNQAWQAFLKTLEEPNSKTIFIFCTTEVNKVPTTILNRVQRFDLTKIDNNLILNRLRYICCQEGFGYEQTEDGLKYIVKLSKGRMRDAIAYLEKVSSFSNNIHLEECIKCLNSLDYKIMFDLINNIYDRNVEACLDIINKIDFEGKDLKLFINDFTSFITDINKYLILKSFDNIDIPSYYQNELNYSINIEESKNFFVTILQELVKLKDQIRYETNIKTNIDIMIIYLCK